MKFKDKIEAGFICQIKKHTLNWRKFKTTISKQFVHLAKKLLYQSISFKK